MDLAVGGDTGHCGGSGGFGILFLGARPTLRYRLALHESWETPLPSALLCCVSPNPRRNSPRIRSPSDPREKVSGWVLTFCHSAFPAQLSQATLPLAVS